MQNYPDAIDKMTYIEVNIGGKNTDNPEAGFKSFTPKPAFFTPIYLFTGGEPKKSNFL